MKSSRYGIASINRYGQLHLKFIAWDLLEKYLVPLGGLLTFTGTLINIYYTRKNTRSTKYIDTITSERIKWIEKIRLEVSDSHSTLQVLLKNHHIIKELESEKEADESVMASINRMKITSPLATEIETFSSTEILKKINIITLRLNPAEDRQYA